MMRKPAIEVRALCTGYSSRSGGIVVSDRITETLYSGELTCLLGPNGAGKSTILKTISAFIPPLDGEIIIEGKNIAEYTDAELARVIGVVLTERITLNNMSVESLVSMGRSPYTGFWGRLSSHDRDVVEEAISLVRIEDLRGRMVQTLSDGERQKVMIAKALAQETPVIFLDEPTAFLDYPSKVEILQLLQKLSRIKRKTVFLSTHDLELALQIADKVWLIDKKHGVVTGNPEDLSLSGEMGRFFEREGVWFDTATGLFRIKSRPRGYVHVSGNGARRVMVEKALMRNEIGVSPGPCGSNTIMIDVTDDCYRINGRSFCSIGELIDTVCDLSGVGD